MLHQLKKINAKTKKRLGRGLGSGKGKTAGRGVKGQKKRGKIASGFIGGTLPLYKKLPFKRGWGNAKRSAKFIPINLAKLNIFPAEAAVNILSLLEKKLVKEEDVKKSGVKIVAGGKIEKTLFVNLPATKKAVQMIEKAGGKVLHE